MKKTLMMLLGAVAITFMIAGCDGGGESAVRTNLSAGVDCAVTPDDPACADAEDCTKNPFGVGCGATDDVACTSDEDCGEGLTCANDGTCQAKAPAKGGKTTTTTSEYKALGCRKNSFSGEEGKPFDEEIRMKHGSGDFELEPADDQVPQWLTINDDGLTASDPVAGEHNFKIKAVDETAGMEKECDISLKIKGAVSLPINYSSFETVKNVSSSGGGITTYYKDRLYQIVPTGGAAKDLTWKWANADPKVDAIGQTCFSTVMPVSSNAPCASSPPPKSDGPVFAWLQKPTPGADKISLTATIDGPLAIAPATVQVNLQHPPVPPSPATPVDAAASTSANYDAPTGSVVTGLGIKFAIGSMNLPYEHIFTADEFPDRCYVPGTKTNICPIGPHGGVCVPTGWSSGCSDSVTVHDGGGTDCDVTIRFCRDRSMDDCTTPININKGDVIREGATPEDDNLLAQLPEDERGGITDEYRYFEIETLRDGCPVKDDAIGKPAWRLDRLDIWMRTAKGNYRYLNPCANKVLFPGDVFRGGPNDAAVCGVIDSSNTKNLKINLSIHKDPKDNVVLSSDGLRFQKSAPYFQRGMGVLSLLIPDVDDSYGDYIYDLNALYGPNASPNGSIEMVGSGSVSVDDYRIFVFEPGKMQLLDEKMKDVKVYYASPKAGQQLDDSNRKISLQLNHVALNTILDKRGNPIVFATLGL